MEFTSKKRNYLLIGICLLVYMCTYLLKYSYSANIVNFETDFNISHSETGLVTTLFFITYGLGQFVNGILVKKYNLKIVVPIAILISSIINILVMLVAANNFSLVKYLWLINGAVLSMLWPCTIRMITENVSPEYENKAIFLTGLVTGAGITLTYLLSAIFTKLNNYKIIFLVGAIIGVFFCLVWLFSFNKISSNQTYTSNKVVVHKESENTSFFIYVGITCLFCVSVIFVRDGISNWCPSILSKTFNISNSLSVLISIILPISQLIAALCVMELKKLVKSHMLLSTYMILITIFVLCLPLLFMLKNLFTLLLALFVTTFCLTVVTVICTSIIPMVWSKFRNGGLYAGIFNGCCYCGAAAASYGLGAIADNGSWFKVFVVLVVVLSITALISLVYLLIAKIYRLGYDESGDTRVRK